MWVHYQDLLSSFNPHDVMMSKLLPTGKGIHRYTIDHGSRPFLSVLTSMPMKIWSIAS
jgi:hypothetical protein